MKNFLFTLVLASFTYLFIFWFKFSADTNLKIVMCDVGQGDAFLIIKNDWQMLIDGGPNESNILNCLRDHLPAMDEKIEVVVATHADADHITGLTAVFMQYHVDSLLMSNRSNKETTVFKAFQEIVQMKIQNGLVLIQPEGQALIQPFENLSIGVLHPQTAQGLKNVLYGQFTVESPRHTEHILQDIERYLRDINLNVIKDENDLSIVLLFKYHQVTALFTGDISEEIELAMVKHNLIEKIDILKISHHGSKTSTSPLFLNLTQPEWSLLSVGKKNRFGHPHSAVINRVEEVSSYVLRTDLSGSVVLASDGVNIWQEK